MPAPRMLLAASFVTALMAAASGGVSSDALASTPGDADALAAEAPTPDAPATAAPAADAPGSVQGQPVPVPPRAGALEPARRPGEHPSSTPKDWRKRLRMKNPTKVEGRSVVV